MDKMSIGAGVAVGSLGTILNLLAMKKVSRAAQEAIARALEEEILTVQGYDVYRLNMEDENDDIAVDETGRIRIRCNLGDAES